MHLTWQCDTILTNFWLKWHGAKDRLIPQRAFGQLSCKFPDKSFYEAVDITAFGPLSNSNKGKN